MILISTSPYFDDGSGAGNIFICRELHRVRSGIRDNKIRELLSRKINNEMKHTSHFHRDGKTLKSN